MTAAPDERAFREHVTSAHFLDGVQRGKWRIVGELEWPHVVIAVAAANRCGATREFFLRIDAAGYPVLPPTFMPWDPVARGVLHADRRPQGGRAAEVFRSDWEGGKALYAPFDRVALRAHGDWAQRHSPDAWNPQKGLTRALQLVHEYLNEDGYRDV